MGHVYVFLGIPILLEEIAFVGNLFYNTYSVGREYKFTLSLKGGFDRTLVVKRGVNDNYEAVEEDCKLIRESLIEAWFEHGNVKCVNK